jgi:thioredoxin-like negative regulator of GroEL
MALALLNEGSGRQAAPVFRELLEHVPQFWPAELGLAKVDWQLGNIDQAKTILETLIEKQPTAAEPVRLLAILLADSHPGLSRDVLERYLERFPDADQVRDCLAELELAEPISTQVEQTSGGSP